MFTIRPTLAPKKPAIKHFVDGITAAAIGAIAGAVIVLAKRQFHDVITVLIAIASAIVLLQFKKIPEPVIILIAALIGLLVKFTT